MFKKLIEKFTPRQEPQEPQEPVFERTVLVLQDGTEIPWIIQGQAVIDVRFYVKPQEEAQHDKK